MLPNVRNILVVATRRRDTLAEAARERLFDAAVYHRRGRATRSLVRAEAIVVRVRAALAPLAATAHAVRHGPA